MLVVRVGGQPGDNRLRAGDAAGTDTRGAHVGGVTADNHGARRVAGRAPSHRHRAHANPVRL